VPAGGHAGKPVVFSGTGTVQKFKIAFSGNVNSVALKMRTAVSGSSLKVATNACPGMQHCSNKKCAAQVVRTYQSLPSCREELIKPSQAWQSLSLNVFIPLLIVPYPARYTIGLPLHRCPSVHIL
jgi:hypothetical protein